MERLLALAFAVSFLALGCAKDKGGPAPTTAAGAFSSNDPCAATNCQKANPPELNPTQKMAQNVALTCKDEDCDPSVGLLSIVDKHNDEWSAGQCTASLIGPDLLVTNGHCIPKDLSKPGSSCANRLWITFGNDKAHPEYDKQLGCDQVLFSRAEGGPEGADYAYLKLARASNRPVLRQSTAGFENAKVYHLHKINPARIQGGVGGRMEKVDCTSLYDSAIFDAPLDRLSSTSFFVDCRVIPGNSGSPILADDGTVRGVIYAFVQKEKIRGVFNKNGSKVPEAQQIADLNIGSNFACLTLPGDNEGRALAKECANPQERIAQKKKQAEAERVKLLRPEAQRIIKEKAEGRPDVVSFGWSLSVSTSETLGVMGLGIPECVNTQPAASLLEKSSEMHRPFFYVRADYNAYLQASAHGLVFGGFAVSSEKLDLSKADDSSFNVEISDPDNGQSQFRAQLSACSKN